jgi:hypothetical protein
MFLKATAKILVEHKRPCYNFVPPLEKETEFHINYKSDFSGKNIPVKLKHSDIYIKAIEVCRFE